MKTLLITTAFLTAPIATVSAQSTDVLKSQVAEQNRQIIILEKEVRSLQSLLDLERARHSKVKTSPKTAVRTPSTSTTLGKTHTIVAGETFSSIARKHKVSLSSLIAANKDKNPNKISIGDKVNLPGNSVKTTVSVKPAEKKTVRKPASSRSSYKVATGDTFYGIARKNGVSVARIIALNPGIKPSKLQIGQVVKLTGTASKPISAPVKKEVQKSRMASKPTTKKPAKKTASKPVVESRPVSNVTKKNIAKTVTVKSVMTYGAFAAKNGTTISVLNKLNGLDLPSDEPMAVGSALYVPNNY